MCQRTDTTNAVVRKAVQTTVKVKEAFTAVTIRKAIPKTNKSTLPQIGTALSKLFSTGEMGPGYSCICIFDNFGQKVFKLYRFSQADFEDNEGNLLRFNGIKPVVETTAVETETKPELDLEVEETPVEERLRNLGVGQDDSALNETKDELNDHVDCSVETTNVDLQK